MPGFGMTPGKIRSSVEIGATPLLQLLAVFHNKSVPLPADHVTLAAGKFRVENNCQAKTKTVIKPPKEK